MAAKPRILTDHKDMIWSLIPLLVICVIIAAVSGNCAVGLSGKADEDRTPAYDIRAGLTADASTIGFPIRLPEIPAGWKPNSGSRKPVDNTVVSNSGFITNNGVYIQYSQTNAPEDSLVGLLSTDQAVGKGTVNVGGRQWVQYSDGSKRQIWVANFGDVRIGLSGRAGDDDFRTLAAAAAAAPVVKANSLPRPSG
ncbi:DUF4245 domain-containing protein [Williamsia sp. CHRR-6]|uniref:DUF4245 domain-containing protein n=1 Tax=Williamsia sp. CHRR-6 TaxID=2835871 RepID=UPI001BD9CAD8|nr:DUF4245 domain-containing protein [Williamsia sp. CHRR-6]MBT0566730.1 DUF4245 domain-containing protein [Williamsia sp. CHRR-6]